MAKNTKKENMIEHLDELCADELLELIQHPYRIEIKYFEIPEFQNTVVKLVDVTKNVMCSYKCNDPGYGIKKCVIRLIENDKISF